MRRTIPRAFTLVEVILVVLILGVLAAIVLPKFSGATEDSRAAAAQSSLQHLREQIEVFKSQHGNTPPQEGALWTILLTTSSTTETTAPATGTNFGPYFRIAPTNPWSDQTAASNAATDTNAGW